MNHQIRFEQTQALSRDKQYHTQIYREAIEIHKHQQNMNRKEAMLSISDAWLPALKGTRILRFKNIGEQRVVKRFPFKPRWVSVDSWSVSIIFWECPSQVMGETSGRWDFSGLRFKTQTILALILKIVIQTTKVLDFNSSVYYFFILQTSPSIFSSYQNSVKDSL